jgi:hypothetical protein
MTITERYDEIMALLPEGTDLGIDEAPIEAYIISAAEVLGFRVPAVALDLEMPMATLMDLYGHRT